MALKLPPDAPALVITCDPDLMNRRALAAAEVDRDLWDRLARQLYLALKTTGMCRCQRRTWWGTLPESRCSRCAALDAFEIASGCRAMSDTD